MMRAASGCIGGALLAAAVYLAPHAMAATTTTVPVGSYYSYFGNTQGGFHVENFANNFAIYYAGANEDIVSSVPPPIKNVDGRTFEALTGGTFQIDYAINNYRFAAGSSAGLPSPATDFLAINLVVNNTPNTGTNNDCSTYGLIPGVATQNATSTLYGNVSHSCMLKLSKGNRIKLTPTWTVGGAAPAD